MINIRQFSNDLAASNVEVIYSGPIWASGIDGMAELLLKRLEYDDMPLKASQAVFSAFVEQMNNMLMFSAESEQSEESGGKKKKVPRGVYILGVDGPAYFILTGNSVTPQCADALKERLSLLNSMSKDELRQYYKQQLKAGCECRCDDLGLIEVARRVTEPIKYNFEPLDDGLMYFTMYLTINQGRE